MLTLGVGDVTFDTGRGRCSSGSVRPGGSRLLPVPPTPRTTRTYIITSLIYNEVSAGRSMATATVLQELISFLKKLYNSNKTFETSLTTFRRSR